MNRMRIHGAQFALGLLLALTLWTYVSFTTNPNTTRQIPMSVEQLGPDDGLVVVNTETGLPETFAAQATLTVTGPQEELGGITASKFRATVDFAGLKPGVNRVPIKVTAPPSVRVQGYEPADVTVRLARDLARTVPITVKPRGQPPFSFSPGEISQGAREAVARGPEDQVQQVSAAVADLDLQGQTATVSATLPLRAVNRSGETVAGISLTPQRVSVQAPIVAQVAVQQVAVVPDLQGQPALGYAVASIDWEPKTIEVFTPGAITATLRTEPISLTDATSGITRTVGLQRMLNIITRPTIVRIAVRVGIVPIKVQSQLPQLVPVSPVGLGTGLVASAEPTSVSVTLAGPFDRLNRLKPGDIAATVDLTGLGPGAFTLPVKVNVPAGLSLVPAAELRVRVTIRPAPTPTAEPGATPTAPPTATPPP